MMIKHKLVITIFLVFFTFNCISQKNEKLLSKEALTSLKSINPNSTKATNNPEAVLKVFIRNKDENYIREVVKKYKNIQWLQIESDLVEDLPVEIKCLQNLQVLEFLGKNLKSYPIVINSLKNLRILTLARTDIESINIISEELQNLEVLNLYQSKVSSLNLQLNKLNTLVLDFNPLKSLPSSIYQILALQNLSIKGVQWKNLPRELSNLKYLKKISLDYCEKLDYNQTFEVLGNIKKLEVLSLYGCKLTILPDKVSQLKELKELNLYGNPLNLKSVFNVLSLLPKLNKIDIGDINILPLEIQKLNQITELNILTSDLSSEKDLFRKLRGLTKLRSLDLSSLKIQNLSSHIGDFTALDTLNLYNNKIVKIPLEIAKLSSSLRYLNLNQNPLSDAEKSKLRNLLPNTKLVFTYEDEYGKND